MRHSADRKNNLKSADPLRKREEAAEKLEYYGEKVYKKS